MTLKEYNNCVDQLADPLFRYLLRLVGVKADAEDILQSTFEKLWMKKDDVEFGTARSYLFTMAHNGAIDFHRKYKRMSFPEQMPERTGSGHSFEMKELLEKALATLSDVHRSVLLLRDHEGYSYEEIATISDLSLEQVKVNIFRARKKMQEWIGNHQQQVQTSSTTSKIVL
jgi:RNA polymerase sigma-70 factor (ECF subfamily)